MRVPPEPTGRDNPLGQEDIIVSKTDLKGRITYVNNVFVDISKFSEAELLGQPHNIIRHPDMPRTVFKVLWDRLDEGKEIFCYVLNLCKDGDHYWVFAHVTPSINSAGDIVGYHSNRRAPAPAAVAAVNEVYQELLAVEAQHARKADAIAAGMEHFTGLLEQQGVSYDEYVWGLVNQADDHPQ